MLIDTNSGLDFFVVEEGFEAIVGVAETHGFAFLADVVLVENWPLWQSDDCKHLQLTDQI